MSEKEIEELKETIHKLRLTAESTKQSHRVEVEYLKEEIQGKETELKSLGSKLKGDFNQSLANLKERLASVTEDFHQSRDENNVLKGQVDQLQKTVEHLKTIHHERHNRTEQIETIKITSDQLNSELSSARSLLASQQSKVHGLTQLVEKQKERLSELKEDLEAKDQCISQLQSRMREMETERQEAILQLQQTVMMQHKASEEVEDPTKRGNSLFSEVDQRRVKVEEELNRLRERVARLTTENVELQATIERGDCRSQIIVQQLQLIHKSEKELIQELKKLKSENIQSFEGYRDRLETLKNEYKRKLTQYRAGVDSPGILELETVREERDLLVGQKMSLEREHWETRKELKYVRQQKTESDANLKILRVKLLAAQDQLELMSKSDKVKLDGHGSLEGTPGGTGAGGSGDQKWLYNSILNESKRNLPSVSIPSSVKSKGTGTSSSSQDEDDEAWPKRGQGQIEEIPGCKTQ